MRLEPHNAILYIGAAAAPVYYEISCTAAPLTHWYLVFNVPLSRLPWSARGLIVALLASMLFALAFAAATCANLLRRWLSRPLRTCEQEAICTSLMLISASFAAGYLGMLMPHGHTATVLAAAYLLAVMTRIEFFASRKRG